MTKPQIHGRNRTLSASAILQAVADDLSQIKMEDRLTWADVGAVLTKSDDQAAKYADGTAEMGIVAYARGKTAWNGRFTGTLERMIADTRGETGMTDRAKGSALQRAALALSEVLEDRDQIDAADVRQNRKVLEDARDALNELLAKQQPKAVYP